MSTAGLSEEDALTRDWRDSEGFFWEGFDGAVWASVVEGWEGPVGLRPDIVGFVFREVCGGALL